MPFPSASRAGVHTHNRQYSCTRILDFYFSSRYSIYSALALCSHYSSLMCAFTVTLSPGMGRGRLPRSRSRLRACGVAGGVGAWLVVHRHPPPLPPVGHAWGCRLVLWLVTRITVSLGRSPGPVPAHPAQWPWPRGASHPAPAHGGPPGAGPPRTGRAPRHGAAPWRMGP